MSTRASYGRYYVHSGIRRTLLCPLGYLADVTMSTWAILWTSLRAHSGIWGTLQRPFGHTMFIMRTLLCPLGQHADVLCPLGHLADVTMSTRASCGRYYVHSGNQADVTMSTRASGGRWSVHSSIRRTLLRPLGHRADVTSPLYSGIEYR